MRRECRYDGCGVTGVHVTWVDCVAREIAEGTMELGLGIHGEPGASTAKVTSVDEIVGTLLTNIFAQNEKLSKLPEGSKVALMVNSLGATPLMELYIAAALRLRGCSVPET